MDEIDRKILKLLQDNARVSLKTIAENTFLSSPAVSARIERLEKEGIITGYHASVDPVKLGYHILAYINLEVIPEDKEQFYAYAREGPSGQGYFRLTAFGTYENTVEAVKRIKALRQ